MTTLLQYWHNQTGTKKIILGSSVLILLGALFMLGMVGVPQQIEVVVDGETIQLTTWQKTVGDALEEAEVTLKPADLVTPGLDEVLTGNMIIAITRAFPVEIKMGEQLLEIDAVAQEVSEILELAGITISEDDIIYPGIREIVTAENNKIELIRVTYETFTEEIKVPFSTKIVDDNNAVQGIRQTVQSGKDGKAREEYQVTYHDGEEFARELIHKEVVTEPMTRIVAQGTRPKVMVASRGGNDFKYRQTLTMEATAYTHTGNPTSTGIMPYVGIVAVDPKVIPLGTQVYVDGYGLAKAADIGSAVKGNKIDLFMDTKDEAIKWGRKSVKVYILE